MQQYPGRYPPQAHAGQGGLPAGMPAPILATPPQNSGSVLFVTAGYDHTIRFWQAWQSECTRIINHAEGQVNRLAISPDRRFLAVAANQAVRIYDCSVNSNAAAMAGIGGGPGGGGGGGSSGGGGGGGQGSGSGGGAPGGNNPLITLTGHTGNVTTVCWQQDLKWLATSSEDGTVKVWDYRSARPFRSYTHNDPVNDVVVHPNQGELISCDDGGRMMIWDLAESKCSYTTRPEPDSALRSVTVASDASCLVAGGNSGKVWLYQLGRENKTQSSPPPPSQPTTTDRDPDTLTEAERDPAYQREHPSSDNPNGATRVPGDPASATPSRSTKDPSLLSPAQQQEQQQQQQQQQSDQESSQPFLRKHWVAHRGYLIRALLSPDVRYLATCGADTVIRIWNMDNFDCSVVRELKGHQRWVWDLAFSADSGFLVSASSDHAGRLWDINTGETVRTYNGHDKAIVAVALNDQDRGNLTR
ncbi:unnamed protein product [Tilletia controversa]|uniref:Target of rapamycin complex subunit LST8 n=3 Tax=Tilletia TaxID=13289 RepID=A0A8X7MJY7_9BASI|nr:hypothetical protein CF336_g7398 [Tilletia laevis]KAE8190395.1 hypothetical protein CF328_g5985 [Tilletia controversa]KAE8248369.1 hypothetical protein A4X03_0g6797 [Tilletia caries]KAE8188825.1 hypothetical protein CF335_g6783 [Tilletia laevis]KAE8238682.1 hypothetical protein A4X06_0g8665 [Tilletia controversa]